jgi:hypothetical protein
MDYSITYQGDVHYRIDSDLNAIATSIDAPSEAIDDGFPGASHLGYAWTDLATRIVYVNSDEFGQIGVGRSESGPSLAVDYLPDCHNFIIAWTDLNGSLEYQFLDAAGPALATPNGQINVAPTGPEQHLNVLEQVNAIRPLGGVITVTGQTTPSLAANGDLYFAWTHRDSQVQIPDVNGAAVRDTHEFSRNASSGTIVVASMRRIDRTATEDAFGGFRGDLNYEAV